MSIFRQWKCYVHVSIYMCICIYIYVCILFLEIAGAAAHGEHSLWHAHLPVGLPSCVEHVLSKGTLVKLR